MRVIVIVPRSISPKGVVPRVHMPLGALAIASQLKEDGFDVQFMDSSICDVNANNRKTYFETNSTTVNYDGIDFWRTGISDATLIYRVRVFNPDVIAVSCSTVVDREDTKHIVELLNKEFPLIPIILGGHEASHNYESILSNNSERNHIHGVSCICVGLGQPFISEIVKYFAEKKSNNDLPRGIAVVENGKIVLTKTKEFDINSYALFDYEFVQSVMVPNREKPIDVYSFLGNPHAGNIGFLFNSAEYVSYFPLFTSYGCGFNCTFCDTDQYLLRYSLENVVKMIEKFDVLFGIDYADIMDNNFAGGDEHSRQTCFDILEYLHKNNYKIGFSNGLTFESMTRNSFELLKLFSKHGNVIHIAFPCENGNDRVLKMIRKPHTLKMITDVLEFAKTHLQETNKEGFFIGGFPITEGELAETPQEVDNTIAFIEDALKKQLLQQAIFLKLSPVTSEYRNQWEVLHPRKSFVHCLFSKGAGVWEYDNALLEDARIRVEALNEKYSRKVTRKL